MARALTVLDRARQIVFVGHGLTPGTRVLLIEGAVDAVITQNPHHAMLSCVLIFNNLRTGREATYGVSPAQCEVVFRENLP